MTDASFNARIRVRATDNIDVELETEVHAESNKEAIRKVVKLVDLVIDVLEEEDHVERS